jgi:hypothetical protein
MCTDSALRRTATRALCPPFDGVWYVGDLLEDDGEIVLWDRLGTDLTAALRRI